MTLAETLPPLSLYDDMPDLVPGPGSWMMPAAAFARGAPGLYRGYRAAGANLRTPHRTGGVYVAQNATYASSYHSGEGLGRECRMWRVGLRLRTPFVSDRPVTRIVPELLERLPPGTDSVVMPRGDGNMGNGPVVVLLDPACLIAAEETWTRYEVAVAIQDRGPEAVPPDVLADYPALAARVEEMRARWEGSEVPWRRF